MPRDINGNFTLDPSNPVSPGTVIETGWANPTLTDIAAALTDSLSRSGSGGMTAPFKVADGTVAAPGIAFANEPSSGIYRAGLNDIRFSIGSTDVLRLAPGGIVLPAGKTLTAGAAITAAGLITGNGSFLVPNGQYYKATRNSGSAVVNTMGFDAGSDTLRFRSGGGNPDTEFIDTGANVSLRLISGNAAGIVMGNWPSNPTFAFLQNNQLSLVVGNYALIQGSTGQTAINAAAGQSLAFRIGNADQMSVIAGGTLLQGANGNRNAALEILRNSAYTAEAAALYMMTGTGTVGEVGLYMGTDKARGAGFINSLVPATGAAPLIINGGDGQVLIGSQSALVPQTASLLVLRRAGTSIEFGHNNTAGYVSTIGCCLSNGNPFVAFHAENGATANTFKTRGIRASILTSDLFGGFFFQNVANVNADNQVPVQLAALDNTGKLTVGSIQMAAPAFESAEQAIVANSSAISVAHGLGRTPKAVWCVIRCKTAELGFAVGDELQCYMSANAGNNPALAAWANAVNVGFVVAAAIQVVNKTTWAVTNITAANWKVVLYAL